MYFNFERFELVVDFENAESCENYTGRRKNQTAFGRGWTVEKDSEETYLV